MKGLMAETDEWLRRRILAIYWKQWRRVKTRYRNLRALKLEEWQVHQIANSRKGYWRTAKMLNVALGLSKPLYYVILISLIVIVALKH